ncbi:MULTISPECIES: RsmB/NOP family class I SAM-dependent RNA methyltransferase [Pseudomonadati]|uniref:RsmB/NOP family class I SAM-dependent RNA methyltransferase n=1 Tax=unclassified Halobacteriovorax TaxID=2639665 RepID=UPI001304B521|nr:RsmB/NOP family class I SAM-dependent RNA methyltransferase [Halobacteriovorax sp. DA5]
MKNQAAPTKGPEGFEYFYSQMWGQRWPSLKDSFTKKEEKAYRRNIWFEGDFIDSDEIIAGVYANGEVSENQQIKSHYIMDAASVIVARNLNPTPGSKVLDMCAAPGGKSLVLFEEMQGKGHLVLNELSRNRKERLRRVISEYVPEEMRDVIDIRGFDGNKYGLNLKDEFDFVLLDAPCSGERHTLNDQKYLNMWSKKRTKNLAATQYSLLCSALLTLKSGGEVLYSTCSISSLENDEVIAKVLKKRADQVELVQELNTFGFGEKTEYGTIFLPDAKGEIGPLYMCKLRKK